MEIMEMGLDVLYVVLLSSGGNEQEDNRTARRGQSYKDRSGTGISLVQGWVCDGRRRKDD